MWWKQNGISFKASVVRKALSDKETRSSVCDTQRVGMDGGRRLVVLPALCCLHLQSTASTPAVADVLTERREAFPSDSHVLLLQGVRGHCSAGSEGDLPDTRHHTGSAFTRKPVTNLCCSGCKSPLPKPLLDFPGHLRDLVSLRE